MLVNIERMDEINITMQQLKQQRLTPAEKFVVETIKDAKAKEPDSLGDVKWYKDGDCLFRQDFKVHFLFVNYNIIWSVLEKEYGFNGYEIIKFLTKLLYKYTNNGKLKYNNGF